MVSSLVTSFSKQSVYDDGHDARDAGDGAAADDDGDMVTAMICNCDLQFSAS